jgi:galactose mutarotase-like enzyme
MHTALRLGTWKGQPSVTLVAGEHDATFLPGCGMLCASVRHRGEEFVAWPRTLAEFLEGRMTAVPFVHPWGNRISGRSYRLGRREVDLRGLHLPTDPNGLFMHGNLRGAPFDVVRAAATPTAAHLVARLDYGARPDLMEAFPFPHVVTIDARLNERELRLTTEIQPTARTSVPVSFCWHPFVQIPGAPRATWNLRWPRCERLLVDDRIIPTGERVTQPAENDPLADRTFDDHYALGTDRRFALQAAGRRLEMRFGATYPVAQLYVPARGNFAAIEPMTAPIDALGRGQAPLVKPAERFRAWFTIAAQSP